MLKSHNLFSRYDVIANVETLDMTFLKGVGKLLNIVHNDQIVANIQILERAVFLSNDFAEFGSGLAGYLGV